MDPRQRTICAEIFGRKQISDELFEKILWNSEITPRATGASKYLISM